MFKEIKNLSLIVTAITILFSTVIVPHALADEIVVTDVSNNNTATVTNNISSANENLGDVAILSGDVVSEISINNAVNGIEFTCCDPEDLPANNTSDQPSAPAPANASSGSGLSAGTVAGTALSMATGNILPITGTNWLFLAIIGNVLLLIFGACLRLHSGNSPGAALAL